MPKVRGRSPANQNKGVDISAEVGKEFWKFGCICSFLRNVEKAELTGLGCHF